jgi:hypothetical protein
LPNQEVLPLIIQFCKRLGVDIVVGILSIKVFTWTWAWDFFFIIVAFGLTCVGYSERTVIIFID